MSLTYEPSSEPVEVAAHEEVLVGQLLVPHHQPLRLPEMRAANDEFHRDEGG